MYWSVYGDDFRQLYWVFIQNMACYNAGNVLNSSNLNELTDDNDITDDLSIIPLEKDSFG